MHPTLGEESVVLGGGEAVRHPYLVADNFDRTVQAGQGFLGHYLTVGHLGGAGENRWTRGSQPAFRPYQLAGRAGVKLAPVGR